MRQTSRYVFFFGKDDFLSNWHPSAFSVNGVTFNCVEQFMMYSKAMLFGDLEVAAQVLSTTDPKTQKALGRKVKNFNSAAWDAKRLNIVTVGCREKFAQNRQLFDLLIATGSRELVEASPYDRVWGIGLRETDPVVETPSRWRGLNLLGQALMAARAILVGNQPCHGTNTLEAHRTGLGSTAWRITEPDAPSLFALVYDTRSMTTPTEPETDTMAFVIFKGGIQEPIGSVDIDGRAGLNRWYLQHVGHEPDKGPEGECPIMELIINVAAHMMLRHSVEGGAGDEVQYRWN